MNAEELIALLRSAGRFRALDAAALRRLVALGTPCGFAEGETLFRKGESAQPFFYMIVAGSADVLLASGERAGSMGPGEIVGEIGPVSRSKVRMRTVVAAEPLQLLRWELPAIEAESSELHEAVLRAMKDLAWERANPVIRKLAGENE